MYRVVIVDTETFTVLTTNYEDKLEAAMGISYFWNGVENTRAYVYINGELV